MSGLPRRIKCGSRSINVTRPNWHTGLATIGLNDCGTISGFTMDHAATRKVIEALQELERRQLAIEFDRDARRRHRQ